MLKSIISRNRLQRAAALGLLVCAVLIFPGCNSKGLKTKVGSHQVRVDREGFAKRFGVTERGNEAIFIYEGYCTTGQLMKVYIKNDEVLFNDRSLGALREGDAVVIDEDGVTVNDLDHGQTEKYLKENGNRSTAAL
jgi:hypothetical protein